MWNLNLPDAATAIDELVVALTKRNGTRILSVGPRRRKAVIDLYSRYDELRGRASAELKGGTLGRRFLRAIHNAYAQVRVGGRLANLRDRLKIGVDLCPYCGFGEIQDLDHYLPRTGYEGLAVYCRNLVPCCSRCNNKKRASGGNNANDQFFHAYFDALPDHQVLRAIVTVSPADGVDVQYALDLPQGLDPALELRIRYQFQRLELNERYQAQSNMFLFSQRPALETVFGPTEDVEALREFLQGAAVRSQADFGRNDWRTALWRALAESQPFYEGGFKHAFS